MLANWMICYCLTDAPINLFHLEYTSSSMLPIQILLIVQHSSEMSFPPWSLTVFSAWSNLFKKIPYHLPIFIWHILSYMIFTSLHVIPLHTLFFLWESIKRQQWVKSTLGPLDLSKWVQIPALSFLSDLGQVTYLSELISSSVK